MTLKIPRFACKAILWLSNYFNDNNFLLVCKGYDEDYELYTGLFWTEDSILDFYDESYSDFQLWINLFNQRNRI